MKGARNMAHLDTKVVEMIDELIRPNTPVLICPAEEELVQEIEMLVRKKDGIPLIPKTGYAWKDLFRLAFSNRASVVIGQARIVQGLYKLVHFYRISLRINHAVVLCEPQDDWMFADIASGLDCRVYPVVLPERECNESIRKLERELLAWTSILDCHAQAGESGLELKVVYFLGERMPPLPSCAKLQMIPCQIGDVAPFSVIPGVKNS